MGDHQGDRALIATPPTFPHPLHPQPDGKWKKREKGGERKCGACKIWTRKEKERGKGVAQNIIDHVLASKRRRRLVLSCTTLCFPRLWPFLSDSMEGESAAAAPPPAPAVGAESAGGGGASPVEGSSTASIVEERPFRKRRTDSIIGLEVLRTSSGMPLRLFVSNTIALVQPSEDGGLLGPRDVYAALLLFGQTVEEAQENCIDYFAHESSVSVQDFEDLMMRVRRQQRFSYIILKLSKTI